MLGDILGDVFGAVSGWAAGQGMRRPYFRRKLQTAKAGGDVRLRVRAHPDGAPHWKYWRGNLIRRGSSVSFMPLLRRWRGFDLRDAEVGGMSTRQSAADGDRVMFTLAQVPRCDLLAVSLDGAPVAEVLLVSAHE